MSVDPTTTAVFGLTFAVLAFDMTRRPRNAFSWCDPKFSNVPPIFFSRTAKTALGHPSLRARGAAGVVVPTRAASDRK
jgi:hypothetical protein